MGKLSDAKLRALKAAGKVQKLADGGCLYIHVTAKGSRLWRLAYSFEGKQKTLVIGAYPAVSLAGAPKARDEAKELLARGLDPSHEKRRVKLESQEAAKQAARTFRAIGMEWADTKKDGWAASNYQKKMRLLEILFAGMGEKNITDIVPADILAIAAI